MDARTRLAILSESPDRDGLPLVGVPGRAVGVAKVRLPGGGTTTLMRVMQTNACSLSCGYCPTFCGGNVKRTALSSEEVARTFIDAQRARLADGLFLTSGVPGRPVRMMDRMLATLDILRRDHGFRGYVHVKILPGAEPAQVAEAVRLASRVSVNLEGPADHYVRALAKEKDLSGDLLPKLEQAGRLFAERRGEPSEFPRAGTTTQFVVGAAGEPDREILALVARLERARLLHHAHFSAFQPVIGTPMQARPATPAARELRLYQAEHLLRAYGFSFDELVFETGGNLALDVDPKTAWALAHPEYFPLEVTRAPYELLLRVPGLGPKAARTLVTERRRVAIRGVADLRRLGIDTVRAGYFLAARGQALAATPAPQQLRLFAPGRHLPQAPFKTDVPPCAYR